MKKVINRKARFNYELLERIEAGVALEGREVKSIKQGKVSLNEAFCRIDDNQELWLHNTHVHPYEFANNDDYEPTRTRKLLLKKSQILSLEKKTENKNLSLVPTAIYTKHGRIKVEVTIGRGKKQWDKRATIKEREQKREARRAMKHSVRG
jgi:SsrA-binding protein